MYQINIKITIFVWIIIKRQIRLKKVLVIASAEFAEPELANKLWDLTSLLVPLSQVQ